MKSGIYSVLLPCIIAILTVSEVRSQAVTIIEVPPISSAGKYIIESPAAYPGSAVDTIWQISENVDLRVLDFQIDGQSGDFVLLGKYPLPDVDPNQLLKFLPVSEYIMLSWQVEEEQTFRLINPKGLFIYFHGENNEDRTARQVGFRIELTPFDKPEPISTTTESPVRPPPPGTEAYVQRFVTGKTPAKFLTDLTFFKDALANMTNDYLDREEIARPNQTEGADVIIPIAEIRFCDRSWPEYKTCVEVTFAITGYDNTDAYMMTRARIDEMWSLLSADLIPWGYRAYDAPGDSEELVPWVWLAASLGTILAFSLVLCLAWLKKSNADFKRDALLKEAMPTVQDEGTAYFDRKTPIYNVLKTMNNGKGRREEHDRDLVHMSHSPNGNVYGMRRMDDLDGDTYHPNPAFESSEDEFDENEDEFNNNNRLHVIDPSSTRLRHARLSEVPSASEAEADSSHSFPE